MYLFCNFVFFSALAHVHFTITSGMVLFPCKAIDWMSGIPDGAAIPLCDWSVMTFSFSSPQRIYTFYLFIYIEVSRACVCSLFSIRRGGWMICLLVHHWNWWDRFISQLVNINSPWHFDPKDVDRSLVLLCRKTCLAFPHLCAKMQPFIYTFFKKKSTIYYTGRDGSPW